MKCKVCQKEFSSEIGLLQHQSATSCGQSLFKCRMCQKDFGNKPALLQHIAAVHPKGSVAGGAVLLVEQQEVEEQLKVCIVFATFRKLEFQCWRTMLDGQ